MKLFDRFLKFLGKNNYSAYNQNVRISERGAAYLRNKRKMRLNNNQQKTNR